MINSSFFCKSRGYNRKKIALLDQMDVFRSEKHNFDVAALLSNIFILSGQEGHGGERNRQFRKVPVGKR